MIQCPHFRAQLRELFQDEVVFTHVNEFLSALLYWGDTQKVDAAYLESLQHLFASQLEVASVVFEVLREVCVSSQFRWLRVSLPFFVS